MLKLGIILSCVVVIVSGVFHPNGKKNDTTKAVSLLDNFSLEKIVSVNKLVDVLLHEIGLVMVDLKIDPFQVPNVTSNLNLKLLGVKTKEQLKLFNGTVSGFSNISRAGDLEINYKDRALRVKVPLKINQIAFDFGYLIAAQKIVLQKGHVIGKAHNIKVTTDIIFHFKPLKVELKDFSITNAKDLNVQLKGGNKLTNIVANTLIGAVSTVFREIIDKALSEVIYQTLVQTIKLINTQLDHLYKTVSFIG